MNPLEPTEPLPSVEIYDGRVFRSATADELNLELDNDGKWVEREGMPDDAQ